jgi:GNAT superfamily N-acetyltransferase
MLLTLLDGTTVFVRPIAPEDKPLLIDGLRRLSPETAYRRFLSPKVRFSAAELRYLTEVDGHDHIALVAVDVHQPGMLIAVARCVRTAPETAEMAIVVGDPWQGLGLGKRLAALLAEAAAAEGVTRIAGTMLADNRPALRLLKGIGDGFAADAMSNGVREVVARIPAAPLARRPAA